MARKWLLRHRFMKIAKGFKKSGASLVLRLRNETLKEIIASERSYVNSLSVVTQARIFSFFFLRPFQSSVLVRLTFMGRST